MKIKMKTISAGPAGVFPVGAEREVGDEEGAALVAGNYAIEIVLPAIETAMLAPALERRLDRMKKEELIALAGQMGVALKGDETNKEIVALLNTASDD